MRFRTITALLVVLLLLVASGAAFATKIGVMGDSLSDEYFEQTYSYAQNWVQQAVTYRGIDLGPAAVGTWGEPRRTGYEYNWARYAATSADLLSAGQHTGLAGQIVPEGIEYGVLMIGSNDLLLDGNNAYLNMYNGSWSAAQIDGWTDGVAGNIATALDTVLPTGVKMLVTNSVDYGITPFVNTYPAVSNAASRQAVADVMRNVLSPKIEAIAAARNLPFLDLAGAMDKIVGPRTALNATLKIGNVDIIVQQSDTPTGSISTAGFVDDGIHPHTTLSGIIANLVFEGLNTGFGTDIALFSETEILAHRGIGYGGSDTLTAQIGPYSDYVINYVPEPSSLALATLAAVALAIVMLRRRSVSVAPTAFRGAA